jgi:hypothetical protein
LNFAALFWFVAGMAVGIVEDIMIAVRCTALELVERGVVGGVGGGLEFPGTVPVVGIFLVVLCGAVVFLIAGFEVALVAVVGVSEGEFLGYGYLFLLSTFVDFPDTVVDEVAVLFEIEFFVVADWGLYDLRRGVFVFGVVELSEVRMFKDIVGCGPICWVELEHFGE